MKEPLGWVVMEWAHDHVVPWVMVALLVFVVLSPLVALIVWGMQ